MILKKYTIWTNNRWDLNDNTFILQNQKHVGFIGLGFEELYNLQGFSVMKWILVKIYVNI